MASDTRQSGKAIELFCDRDVLLVARELIGCLIRRLLADGTVLEGRIVETEAYRHNDPASHSYRGQTARNAAMFGSPGTAYVYLIYGVHTCFNIVCSPPGIADAVLIRAVEPTRGIEMLWRNRFGPDDWNSAVGKSIHSAPSPKTRSLTSGPGNLCRAFGITREEVNATSLQDGPVTIQCKDRRAASVVSAPRIGISNNTECNWRFAERENVFVSKPVPVSLPTDRASR